jgi:hypothetical protein
MQLLLLKKNWKKKPLLLIYPTQKKFKVNKLSLPIYMAITIFHNFQTKNGCCLIRRVCICNLNCLTMTIRTFPLQYSKHPFHGNLVGAREEIAGVQVCRSTATLESQKTKPAPLVGAFWGRKGATRCKIVWSPKGPGIVHEGDFFLCLLPCLFLFVGWLCLFQVKK